MLPEPPSTTAARISADTRNSKLFGLIELCFAANTTPPLPPIAAPIANAASLNLNVGTPISSAASSSSRIEAHARPTRLPSIRLTNTIVTMMNSSSR